MLFRLGGKHKFDGGKRPQGVCSMKKNKLLMMGILALALSFGLVLVSCDDSTPDGTNGGTHGGTHDGTHAGTHGGTHSSTHTDTNSGHSVNAIGLNVRF
jgi:hypothetical protein